jgi:itaconate CoA-transferase
MSPAASLYRAKLTTPAAAVAALTGDSDIAMGMALSEPPALLAALASRVERGDLGGFRLWYFHSMPNAAQSILRFELNDRVRPHCMFLTAIERELMRRGASAGRDAVEFVPTAFSDAPRVLSDKQIDTFLVTVSPMDRHGWFTFGTGNDYATAVARSARRLVVEVNRNMPRVFGESLLHISEVHAIVEHDAPLVEVGYPEPSDAEKVIARTVADMIDDGACLQMGIGSLPSAVCAQLSDRHDLGIHTELLTPALVRLVECGAVTNRRKTTFPGRSVFTFAMGDKALYDFLDDNPSFHSLPVNIVNDPRHIAKNDCVVSVNATLQVDLSGACNSEHMLGRQYSGSGGQLDFVRGARASKGGKSIIACTSTAKDGTVSRIVPTLSGPVTTPRNDVQIVVTEYGWVDLSGKTLHQRAEALIGLAHPAFRQSLEQALAGPGVAPQP